MKINLISELDKFSNNIVLKSEEDSRATLLDLDVKYKLFENINSNEYIFRRLLDICLRAKSYEYLANDLYQGIWTDLSESEEDKWDIFLEFTVSNFILFDPSMTSHLMAELIGGVHNKNSIESIRMWISQVDDINNTRVTIVIQEIINSYNGINDSLEKDDIYNQAVELQALVNSMRKLDN